MTRRLTPIAILLALSTLAAAHAPANASGPLVVHEWGTFTSVAGQDGRAVDWLPLSGPPDLPCFVDRFRLQHQGQPAGQGPHGNARAVLLRAPRHHGEREGPVSAGHRDRMVPAGRRHAGERRRHEHPSAGFREQHFMGRCEGHAWRAGGFSGAMAAAATITWLAGPMPRRFSRGRRRKSSCSIEASAISSRRSRRPFGADGSVVVRNPSGEAVGDIVLFENRGGTMAYDVRHVATGQFKFDPPAPRRGVRGAAGRARENPDRPRPVSARSRSDGRHVARFVVRGRHATLLHRAAKGYRCDPSPGDHAAAGQGRSRVRRTHRARDVHGRTGGRGRDRPATTCRR